MKANTSKSLGMNNWFRLDKMQYRILSEMKKIRKQPFSIANVKRHDQLQRRVEFVNRKMKEL